MSDAIDGVITPSTSVTVGALLTAEERAALAALLIEALLEALGHAAPEVAR